jgi:hypothetical protein
MANGYVDSQVTQGNTAVFSSIFVGEATVSFTAVFINNSSTNTHTYQVGTSWGGSASGSIPPNSSRSASLSSPFLGYQATGNVSIVKYGPNGGVLGASSFEYVTGFPDPPPTPAPSFTDTTVASGTLRKAYSDGVSASNASSYSISSGSLPTGLSFNTSNGAITGTPTEQGSFTFAITASGNGTASSGNLTIQILPPGNRRNSSDFNSNLAVARRYNGTSWVNLTTMKRFNGTAWVDISN